jgi:hypothetical protein
MTKLIKEAIADANAVQAVAEERAKSMLIKEFSPKIKSALASLINEDGVSTGSDQPGGYNPETDQDAVGAAVPAGQNSEDMLKKGDGPEKIQEEDDLEVDAEKVAEEEDEEEPVLEAEDDEEELKEEEDEEEMKEEEEVPAEDEVLEIVDEPSDDAEVPPSVDEEEDEKEVPADAMMEALRRKNRILAKENKQLREAVSTLHSKFKKIDLFNAKLAYAFKLMTQPGLNRNQKRQIAETFDAAKSVREAQLIYKTMKSGLGSTRVVRKPLSNKNVKSVISESTKPSSGYNRMQEMAGL